MTVTSRRFTKAVRAMPTQFNPASAPATVIATGRGWLGQAYDPAVIAIAAQPAVLPITNPHPARNPQTGPNRARP